MDSLLRFILLTMYCSIGIYIFTDACIDNDVNIIACIVIILTWPIGLLYGIIRLVTWRQRICTMCKYYKLVSNHSPCYGCKRGSNLEEVWK